MKWFLACRREALDQGSDAADEDGEFVTAGTILRMVSSYMQITRRARAVAAANDDHATRDQLEDAAEVLAQEYIRSESVGMVLCRFVSGFLLLI